MIPININVKLLLFNQDDKFLAIKRNYTNKKWDLPGGAVELPETIELALKRELLEETGLHCDNFTVVEVQSVYGDDGKYLIFLAYKSFINNSDDVILSHEHSEYKWVSIGEFLELEASSYLKELINRYLNASTLR